MITKSYNPSSLETEMINAIKSLEEEIASRLTGNKLINTIVRLERDNPDVLFVVQDEDGDRHEIVVKVIQRNDEKVNQYEEV